MEYAVLNNGLKMPMVGIGTFLLTPDEAETSVLSALACGYRLIDTANAYVNEKRHWSDWAPATLTFCSSISLRGTILPDTA